MYTYEYPRPAVTVDGLIFNKSGEILLIQRAKDPYSGKWALPGGFLEMDELLVDGCHREIEEETCLKVGELTQFKAYDRINRDPRGRTISVVCMISAVFTAIGFCVGIGVRLGCAV